MTSHQSPVTNHQSPIRVGITGQAGFVGTHLYNTLGLYPEKFERLPFEDSFFQDEKKLEDFVSRCNTIIHLAAMNRHNDSEVIYRTNITLVKQLINACEATNSKPHILFSSSTQEKRDNPYGKSKKEGRELFKQWAIQNQAQFTGLVIPNVFGPFGNPYYNSFIATFCHQLTHGEQPKIETDGQVKLIYVSELVNFIIDQITSSQLPVTNHQSPVTIHIPHNYEVKVSEVLQLLETYKTNYFEKGTIPSLDKPFERNLWNTFLCSLDHESFFPFHLKLNTDKRGSFVETIKLNSGGQVSFSTTVPGITRGNHFHTCKAERFAVIKGIAQIELRRIGTNKIMTFKLNGAQPSFVDMPIWHTHNITNVGEDELYTIFWINEHFDARDPDTYFEQV